MKLGTLGTAVTFALIAGLLFALPAAQASDSCSNTSRAKKIRHYGITCAQAKKVIKVDVGRNKCRKKCDFTKVGFNWSCEQRPSGLNACNSTVGTKRYTVTWDYVPAKKH